MFQLALDPNPDQPLFLQITHAVIHGIRNGRLKPGARLPGSRALAETLGVHRSTVVVAYQELLAEGWIQTSEARGTFVSPDIPDVTPRRFSPRPQRESIPDRLGFEMRSAPAFVEPKAAPRGTLTMGGGVPDARLVPGEKLARAYRRALRKDPRTLLGYGDPRGHERLRTALASMLAATRGLAAGADDLVVTRGAQMAVALAARALIEPGDVVAVEEYGYRPAWEALRQCGARLVSVPVDGEGLNVAVLTALAKRTRMRAIYLTPHHQYPTMVTLAAARRLALLDLARRERIAIIEDDYDHEFHYDGRPVLPLASADRAGVVVYIGTLSKILAPGLRIGYVAAPRVLLERIVAHRYVIDRQGDQAVECAVAELLEDGEVQRHARRCRRIYRARRDFLVHSLREKFSQRLSFEVPAGGMALWVRAHGFDVETWAARALAAGVQIHAARRFTFSGKPRPFVRMGYAALTERELAEAVRRL